MLDARTHARTHGHSGDFILCPMLCIALDRQQDNLRMEFSALNIDFSNRSPDLLGSRKPPHAFVKKDTPKSRYFTVVGSSNACR